MKLLRILLVLLLPSNIVFSQASQLDSAFTYLYEHALFNGVVLLAENGKVVYQKNYGITDISNPQPLQVSSAFNLASISKQFIGAMICLLQEDGKLDVDDKVQKHLPAFPYSDISIRQMLNHTSGLPEYFDLFIMHTGALDTIDNEAVLQLLSEKKPPLDFEPGDKWQYSNTGYVLLGLIIEKCSGQPVADYLHEKVTKPLGLKNTYAFHLKMKTSPENRVYGFRREDGKNKPDDLMRFDGIVGDGGIYSSAEDLLKWTKALYEGKLLKASSLDEMLKPAPLNDGTTFPYGFGIAFNDCTSCAKHTGGWVGFLNLLWTERSSNRTLVVLSNGGSAAGIRAGQQFMKGEKIQLPQTQLITNIQLADGTGSPVRKTSVRMLDERIWEMGNLTPFKGETVFDGKGQTLAPGFIDTHSHHLRGLDEDPTLLPALSQGITTIVTGQDGSSEPMDSLEAAIRKQPATINIASYTGHTTLRLEAMGLASFAGMPRRLNWKK